MAGIEVARKRLMNRFDVLSEMVSRKASPVVLDRMARVVNKVELIDAIRDHAVFTAKYEFMSGGVYEEPFAELLNFSRRRLASAVGNLRPRLNAERREKIVKSIEKGAVFAGLRERAVTKYYVKWLRERGAMHAA